MKEKISPGAAAIVIAVAALVLVGLFYKMNFSGPPPAPKLPMSVSGDAKPLSMAGPPGVGGQGMPAGAERGSGGAAPPPGGGMMAPTLPGGPGGPGGGMAAPMMPPGPGMGR